MTRGLLIRIAFVAVFLLGFWCGLHHRDNVDAQKQQETKE